MCDVLVARQNLHYITTLLPTQDERPKKMDVLRVENIKQNTHAGYASRLAKATRPEPSCFG